MDTLTASDAKREFGELLLKAQKAPVGINKNGKPVAVIVSANDYRDIQKMKQKNFDNAIREGLDDIEAGRVHASDAVFAELQEKDLVAQLKFTEKAKTDLSNIIDYTKETWGVAQAVDYLNNIEGICQLLSRNPRIGKPLDNRIISYPVGSHMVFYQHQNNIVTIIRILHKNMLPENHSL